MVAFQGAIDLGYRYLETDIHATADGVLVCFHDPTLDRTTDASGPVTQRHLADLRKVDAGFRFNPIHHFPHRGTGVTVPTLEEVVTTFPESIITIDLKQAGIEDLLVEAVHRFGVADRVIVGAFKERRVRRFRALTDGKVATSAGPIETAKVVFGAKAGRTVRIKGDVLQVPESFRGIRVVDERVIAAVHEMGKQIHVWTINDVDDMHRLLELGVDGIVTDRPDLLRDVLIERNGNWGMATHE